MAAKTSNRGGFAGMDEDEHREVARRGGQNSHGGRNTDEDEDDTETESAETSGRGRTSPSGSKSQGKGGSQGSKGVISRAIRVLNEIESRIEELKQELEEQSGSGSGSSTQVSRSSGGRGNSRSSSNEDDEDETPGGQGRVKHPETDGRLKQNRDN